MATSDHVDFNAFMNGVNRRNPHQPEFVQAVQEVAEDIFDFIQDKEDYHQQQILRRIPRLLGRRPGQYPRPARLAGAEQQRHRAL